MLKQIKNVIVDLLETLAVSLVIVFILVNFVILPFRVDGSSMYPTLSDSQMGISFICARKLKIDRFDIVIIESDKAQEKLVKRVIGMPGEKIEYIGNRLYVDGEYLGEPFLTYAYTGDFSYTVGTDEYFCLGDNRSASRDSRYYGAFEDREILSTGAFVYYPFRDIGLK